MKQTIDLMAPRWKVIADYPQSIHEVGDILSGASYEKHAPYKGKYPHLFKKLEWWEERKLEEMPEYVKVNTEKSSLFFGDIEKVEQWFMRDGKVACKIERRNDPLYTFSIEHFLPATETEYNNYLKSKS